MAPEKLGSLIGATFGLLFVLVNTAALSPSVTTTLRILAVAVFAAVLVAVRRPSRPASLNDMVGRGGGGFTKSFWFVVAAEVIAIMAGRALLSGPLDMPHAAGAWISLVVGVHFFALAAVWREPFFYWLGLSLLACGALGLVLAAADSSDSAIDLVGGVSPGVLLLAFGLWGSMRQADWAKMRSSSP